MKIYDDKTAGITESEGRFIVPIVESKEDIVFKASFIVSTNLISSGKVEALFDLYVLGDVKANDIEVRGKFVCLGKCNIKGTISIGNNIWADEIKAKDIISNETIYANEITCETISTAGNIIVAKTLSVDILAKNRKNIICGETIFGAGKVESKMLMTGDAHELDHDVLSTEMQCHEYSTPAPVVPISDWRKEGSDEPVVARHTLLSSDEQGLLNQWNQIINDLQNIIEINKLKKYNDINILITLLEIANSPLYKDTDNVLTIYDKMENHFKILLNKPKDNIICHIQTYDDLLHQLQILNKYGNLMHQSIYEKVLSMLVAYLGLKPKFLHERIKEIEWKINDK